MNQSETTAQHRRYIRIHGKLISRSFTRKADADRWYLEKKREKELAESGIAPAIPELTVADYSDQWMRMRKAQGKPESSRNRVHALVSKLYRDALRQDLATMNPMSAIPKLRESQNRWDYWQSLDECRRYLLAAREEGPMFEIFAALALNTGARVGELLALRAQDVQLEKRRIHIWRTYEQETHRIVERTKKAKTIAGLGSMRRFIER